MGWNDHVMGPGYEDDEKDTIEPVKQCMMCDIAKCGPKCACQCHVAKD